MKISTGPRPAGVWPIGAIVFLILALVLGIATQLVQHELISSPTCGLKFAFGIPCLSCGTTRATMLLFAGKPIEAFLMQPMATTFYLSIFIWGAVSTWAWATRRAIDIYLSRRQLVALVILLVMLLATNWIWLLLRGV